MVAISYCKSGLDQDGLQQRFIDDYIGTMKIESFYVCMDSGLNPNGI
jgi:hypothetical protein